MSTTSVRRVIMRVPSHSTITLTVHLYTHAVVGPIVRSAADGLDKALGSKAMQQDDNAKNPSGRGLWNMDFVCGAVKIESTTRG